MIHLKQLKCSENSERINLQYTSEYYFLATLYFNPLLPSLSRSGELSNSQTLDPGKIPGSKDTSQPV